MGSYPTCMHRGKVTGLSSLSSTKDHHADLDRDVGILISEWPVLQGCHSGKKKVMNLRFN